MALVHSYLTLERRILGNFTPKNYTWFNRMRLTADSRLTCIHLEINCKAVSDHLDCFYRTVEENLVNALGRFECSIRMAAPLLQKGLERC